MRRVSIVALLVALVALAIGGFALWRTYDMEDTSPAQQVSSTGGTTSSTVAIVAVPSQAGKHGLVAAEALEAARLKVKISYKASVDVPRERVVSQNPVEGTRVPAGTVIELFLSSGPP